MKTFEYQILQFQPDKVSGEFLNVGIVVFDPAGQQLAFEILSKSGGVAQIFSGSPTRYLNKQLQTIRASLIRIQQGINGNLPFQRFELVAEITSQVFPKDDSSLLFSAIHKTLDLDIAVLTAQLASRMITIQHLDKDKETKTDKDVWTDVYKRYFDERHISQYLQPAKVATKYNEIHFDHSWKNGHLNFFESVNFDLQHDDTIKNKVRRWAGQIDELATADEPSHLYLLSQMPDNNTGLRSYINQFLKDKSSDKVQVEIVTPDKAESVVDGLREEMEMYH